MLGRLRAHVLPLIGSKKISSVSTVDVNTMVRQIVKGETRRDGESGKSRGRFRIRGGEAAARRTVADLAAIYNFAIDRGIVKINPVTGAKKPSARQRRDFLRVEEITKIAAALDQMESEGVNPAGIAILRLLMVTGARPSEIEGLRWSEVDLQARCLRLANTKTGHSVRPLPTVAMTIIAQQPSHRIVTIRFPGDTRQRLLHRVKTDMGPGADDRRIAGKGSLSRTARRRDLIARRWRRHCVCLPPARTCKSAYNVDDL